MNYNAFGELESQTDAKGNDQTLTYDALRALTITHGTAVTAIVTFTMPVDKA